MTRLDRYVLSIFIPAVLVFGAGLVAMAMMIEAILRSGDFLRLKHESAFAFALKFYLLRLPIFVRMTLPMVPLFAAAFTVVRLGRTNELVPMAAAGANLRRIFAPFVAFALLCAGVIAAIEEWVLPPLMPEIAESEALLTAKERSSAVVLSEPGGNYLYAPEYVHPERKMRGDRRRGILLVQVPPDGRIRRVIRAETALWEAGGWRFFDGTVQNYVDGAPIEGPRETHRRPAVRDAPIPGEGIFVPSQIQPSMIRRGAELVKKFVDFRSAREAVRNRPEVPELMTRLTDKFTYPISALLILMLGLPFVAGLQQKTQVMGGIMSLGVCVGYFVAYLIGHDFVNREVVGPALGCWGPSVVFGCLGAAHYGTIRT